MKQKPNKMGWPPYALMKERLWLDDIAVDILKGQWV